MTARPILRVTVAALVVAMGGKATAIEPRPLWLRLEGPWPAPTAALVESDLRTACSRRGLDVRRADEATPPRRPLLAVTTDGETLDHVALVWRAEPAPPVARQLDLTSFPADGRVLALVVAADELLAATGASERTSRPEAPPAAREATTPQADPISVAVPVVVQPAPPATPRARFALDATFAFEHFSGGQAHLGPTVMVTFKPGERWFASLAADARQGRAVAIPEGRVTSRLLGGRVALGANLLGHLDPFALSVDAGVRVARLWFEGKPAADTGRVGAQIGTVSVASDVIIALRARLGRRTPVWIRVATGAGLPLLAQAAAQATASGANAPVTAASGLLLEGQAGLGVEF